MIGTPASLAIALAALGNPIPRAVIPGDTMRTFTPLMMSGDDWIASTVAAGSMSSAVLTSGMFVTPIDPTLINASTRVMACGATALTNPPMLSAPVEPASRTVVTPAITPATSGLTIRSSPAGLRMPAAT